MKILFEMEVVRHFTKCDSGSKDHAESKTVAILSLAV